MTTVHSPSGPPMNDAELVEIPTGEVLIGDRLRRLERRRKLVREQVLAVLVLLVALAATVAVLAMQWLGSGPSTAGAASATPGVAVTSPSFVDSPSGGIGLIHLAGVPR
jgi:hypothetical protein